jgi:hypothetical protein
MLVEDIIAGKVTDIGGEISKCLIQNQLLSFDTVERLAQFRVGEIARILRGDFRVANDEDEEDFYDETNLESLRNNGSEIILSLCLRTDATSAALAEWTPNLESKYIIDVVDHPNISNATLNSLAQTHGGYFITAIAEKRIKSETIGGFVVSKHVWLCWVVASASDNRGILKTLTTYPEPLVRQAAVANTFTDALDRNAVALHDLDFGVLIHAVELINDEKGLYDVAGRLPTLPFAESEKRKIAKVIWDKKPTSFAHLAKTLAMPYVF